MKTLSQKLNESLSSDSLRETLEDILKVEIEKIKEEAIEPINDN